MTTDGRDSLVRAYKDLFNKSRLLFLPKAVRQEYAVRADTLALVIQMYDASTKGDQEKMNTITSNLVKDVVQLESLNIRRNNQGLIQEIIAMSNKLPHGQAALIDPEKVNPSTLANEVYKLRKRNVLPHNVTIVRRKELTYLAKKAF